MSSNLSEEEKEELEGKCMAIWVYHQNDTQKLKIGCDCEIVQGNYVCKLNPF